MQYITYEDFKRVDMRIGLIRFVEPVDGTDKLLRFEIDFGKVPTTCTDADNKEVQDEAVCDTDTQELPFGKQEYAGRDVRQIVSGIREFFPEYDALVGKKALYVLNLEPRKIRGVESHGMLMAVDGLDDTPVFLVPEGTVRAGSQVR